MENPFKHILTGAAAASLAACTPAEEAPQDPFASSTEVSIDANGQRVETVTLPADELSGDEMAARAERERIAEKTNNGQYTEQEVDQILSGQTREVDGMTSEEIAKLGQE